MLYILFFYDEDDNQHTVQSETLSGLREVHSEAKKQGYDCRLVAQRANFTVVGV